MGVSDDLLRETLEQQNALTQAPALAPSDQLLLDHQSQVLERLVENARGNNPDAYAKALNFGNGLDPQFVVANVEEADQLAVTQEYIRILSSNDRLRNWMMSDAEAIKLVTAEELSAIDTFGEMWAARWNEGMREQQLNQLYGKIALGQATQEDRQRAYELTQQARFAAPAPNAQNFFAEGALIFAGEAPELLGGAQAFIRGATVGAPGGALVGAATATAIPVPGISQAAGAIAGMTYGAVAGGTQQLYNYTYVSSVGDALREFLTFRDEKDNPLDPNVAVVAATLVGHGVAALEAIGLGAVLRAVPGVNLVARGLTRDAMREALRVPAVRTAFLRYARAIGIAAAGETGTEVLQELMLVGTGEIAKSISGQEFAAATPDEWRSRITETINTIGNMMLTIGPLIAVPGLVRDLRSVRQSQTFVDTLKNSAAQLAENPFLDRAPDRAAAAINAATLNQQVFFQADEFIELMQDQGQDPFAAVPTEGWRDELLRAQAGGGTVQMSLGDFLVYLGRNPEENPIFDMVRGAPEGFSAEEIRTYSEAYQRLLRGEPGQQGVAPLVETGVPASAVEPPPLTPQAQAIQEGFVNAGVEGRAAEDYARLLDAFATTMADRLGITPDQFYQRARDLSIERANSATITPDQLAQAAYHGSRAIFDLFSTAFMGTGEGAQAFGWGLYFAQNRGVAVGYRRTLAGIQSFVNDQPLSDEVLLPILGEGTNPVIFEMIEGFVQGLRKVSTESIVEALRLEAVSQLEEADRIAANPKAEAEGQADLIGTSVDEELGKIDSRIADIRSFARELMRASNKLEQSGAVITTKEAGALYEVDLPEDNELAVWDERLRSQPVGILDKLKSLPEYRQVIESRAFGMGRDVQPDEDIGTMTFEEFYDRLSNLKKRDEFLTPDELADVQDSRESGWPETQYTYGPQGASELLRDVLGIPGHKFLDRFSRGKDGNLTYNFVIYDDTRINVLNVFRQGERGAIRFMPDKAVISLFEKADLSTALHELGHFFLQTFVEQAQGRPELAADLATLEKELGFTGTTIPRKAHEAFARQFESYLRDGVAPTPGLQSMFDRFRSWLLAVYLKIRNRLPKVNPAIKEVFDRMLATQQQINDKMQLREYELKSAEELGFDPETYAIYTRHVQALRDEAQRNLQRDYVGDSIRWFEGWMQEVYKGIEREVRTRLEGDRTYEAQAKFKKASPLLKMSRQKFSRRFGKEASAALPEEAFGGDNDPEIVAQLLNFASAAEMAEAMKAVRPLDEAVVTEARRLMRERYGMGNLDRTELLNTAALFAMHTDSRTTVLGEEMRQLWRRGGKEMPETALKLARDVARETVRKDKIGTILSGHKYLSAFQRAGRAADRAVIEGDFATAAEQKRLQLVAQEMIREAQRVRKDIEKLRRKALRFTRARPKEVDAAYADQIAQLAAQFDFTTDARRQGKVPSLADFVKRKETEDGEIFEVAQVVESGKRIGFPQLTVEELEGVLAAFDNLEHAGRRALQVRVAGELKKFDDEIQGVLNTLGKQRAPRRFQTERPGAVTRFLNLGNAALTKMESLLDKLDGGDVNGPFHRLILRPLQEGQANAQEDMKDFLDPIIKEFRSVTSKLGVQHFQQKHEIKSLGLQHGQPQFRTTNEIIMVILTGGTNAGMERLEKLGIQLATYDEMLSKLTPDDIQLINNIWAKMEAVHKQVNARLSRITGVRQKDIVARPHGELTGGWIPLTEDYETSRVVSKRAGPPIFDNKAILAALVQRDADTDVPLVFDLETLVHRIHDIYWTLNMREPIKQARKIINEPNVAALLQRTVGQAQVDALNGAFQYLNNQIFEEVTVKKLNRIADHLRIGTTVMALGFNLGTVLLQPLGFFNSIEQIGWKWMWSGLWDTINHPLKANAAANESSVFMRNRFNNIERDIQRSYTKALEGWTDRRQQEIIKFGYYLLSGMDRIVALPTWQGAYNKHLAAHPDDEAGAIAFADQTVRLSQGSAAPVDLVTAARTNGLMKWLTMYYTWLSSLYNQVARLGERTGEAIRGGKVQDMPSLLARWFFLIVAPSIATTWFSSIRMSDEEGEEEPGWGDYTLGALMYPLGTIPFVRILSGAFMGFPPNLSPVEGSLQQVFRAMEETRQIIMGDPDPNWRTVAGGAIQGIGTLFHLPLRPLKQFTLDWFEKAEEGDASLWEMLRSQL